MATGDVQTVPGRTDLSYVDTGMYATDQYGSVYLLDGARPAVVDSGIGADRKRVFDAVDEVLDGRLDCVLLTHVHLDHAGGAGYLAERYDADVYVHEVGAPHLVDPERLIEGTKAAVRDEWRFYDDPRPIPEERIESVTDGDRIDLGDRTLTARHAPGHARHQVVFHDAADGTVFTGDAAGIWIPAVSEIQQTSPPSTFDLDQCLADVRTIEALNPDRLCFAHFGPVDEGVPEVLESYKRTLVEWVQAVREKRAELDDHEAVVAYFGDHARRVDVWGARKARAEAELNTRGVLAYLDYLERSDG